MRWTLTDWERRLCDGPASPAESFTGAELDGLDEPVRRHLSQAIAVGTPLVQCASVAMRGSIKIGRWLPFRARQFLCPHTGFIWSARVAGVITGSDRYLHSVGGMDWKLAGLAPLVHADGPDVSRSAAGRGGAEGVWLPTALLPRYGVTWTAQDERRISARYLVDNTPIDLHIQLGPASDHLVAALEDQDNRLEQTSLGIESEAKFAVWPVLFVEGFDPERPVGCQDRVVRCYSVLECAVVDSHAAKPARALRMASDREMCSRSAMASTAASSSTVRRTATTCIGSDPRPGRPRPRRFIASTS